MTDQLLLTRYSGWRLTLRKASLSKLFKHQDPSASTVSSERKPMVINSLNRFCTGIASPSSLDQAILVIKAMFRPLNWGKLTIKQSNQLNCFIKTINRLPKQWSIWKLKSFKANVLTHLKNFCQYQEKSKKKIPLYRAFFLKKKASRSRV